MDTGGYENLLPALERVLLAEIDVRVGESRPGSLRFRGFETSSGTADGSIVPIALLTASDFSQELKICLVWM